MKWLLPWLAAIAVAGGVVLAVISKSGNEPMQVRSVAIDDSGRVLEVTYLEPLPDCGAPTRVTVEESDEVVEVSARAARAKDGDCPAIARIRTTRIELDAELGSRAVIDGRNGEPIEVGSVED